VGLRGLSGGVVDRPELGHALSPVLFALHRRVLILGLEDSAALRVALRDASGRITMPLPSTQMTRVSSGSPPTPERCSWKSSTSAGSPPDQRLDWRFAHVLAGRPFDASVAPS